MLNGFVVSRIGCKEKGEQFLKHLQCLTSLQLIFVEQVVGKQFHLLGAKTFTSQLRQEETPVGIIVE